MATTSILGFGNPVREDDGVGIAAEDRALAIGRFSQAKSGPGTGLGLPIARRVVENHNGQLGIAEGLNGTCIEIHLPCAKK